MTYRRPLLATDLSEGAEAPARLLPRLVADDAQGRIVHVLGAPDLPPETTPGALLALEQAAGSARVEVEQLLKDWARKTGFPGWSVSARYGAPGPTLAREAADHRADLLALGSTGAGFVERALLGSTARSVLRHAGVDTLIARGEARKIDHVLLATDFQPPSRHAARRARAIADRNGSRVTILHVIDPDLFSLALYPKPAGDRFGPEWMRTHVLDGLAAVNRESFDGGAKELAIQDRAARGVVAKARELAVDLVVVGSHGGGALSRALLGSVAEAIATEAPCSVLVARG